MSKEKTVLIIDDEQDLRDTVGYLFTSKGYKVEMACDGVEGLEKLDSTSPDLIILDMNMPRMNGLDFYGKIKDKNEKPKYPVLVLTARANMEELFRSLDVDGFMAKPFELDQLLKEAELIIKKNSGAVFVDKSTHAKRALRVCIVENHHEIFNKLSVAFLEMGYIVNSAQSGAAAILRMTMDVPDVAVISLGLHDISGDIVIGKLCNIQETKNIKCILYTNKRGDKAVVTQKIAEKQGIAKFVEFSHPNDLLEAAGELIW